MCLRAGLRPFGGQVGHDISADSDKPGLRRMLSTQSWVVAPGPNECLLYYVIDNGSITASCATKKRYRGDVVSHEGLKWVNLMAHHIFTLTVELFLLCECLYRCPSINGEFMKRSIKLFCSTALIYAVLGTSNSASAHVSVYVAGMSGIAINADGATTYEVAFAPGHGCAGPRTQENPNGSYTTTRLVVTMPRNAAGQFILSDPKILNAQGYTAKINRIVDPADAAKYRVESIEYSDFALPAVINGWAAKDAQFFSILVKLPTLTSVKSTNTASLGTSSTASGAKIYFPTMQYCDVAGQGVGVQAGTSTPAATSSATDAVCTANDLIEDVLYDDWTTKGNTPSLVIGTSNAAANVIEILGNAPTRSAATPGTFCFDPNGFNPATARLAGAITATLRPQAQKLELVVDASPLHAGDVFTVQNSNGKVIATGRLNSSGEFAKSVKVQKSWKVHEGSQIRLYLGKNAVAADLA